MVKIKTYGRTTLLANYSEEDLLKMNDADLDKAVNEIITNASSIHEKNRTDTLYLKSYLYGDQDIKNKIKYTRAEINNKTVENWVYAIVDFKKTFLLGKPIQYVQLNDTGEEEISLLNKYCRYENKKAKDMMLYEDVLACGRAFRYTNKDKTGAEDEAPFELINCPVEDTEVVYSSKLGNEQLFAYIVTPMIYYQQTTSDGGEEVTIEKTYNEYTVYFRNKVISYSDKSSLLVRIEGSEKPLLWEEHLITEYFVNKRRISLIEIGKDLFDDINYLESLDKDDMEQFVNAIMVFTNAEVSEEDLDDIKEMGAVCINSTDQKRASVDLLQGRLNATDTQTYYDRLKTSLFQILAVPIASDSGTVTSGDTGKAKLTGQGFTSAGIRAEGDECMFGMCDFNSLKVILKICKNVKKSGIKTLKASDIDSKFQRDMSDNLLVKTQALMNLYECDIPREIANSIINLFGDSHSVSAMQETLFGKQQSRQGSNLNSGNEEQNPNNDNKNINFENNDKTKSIDKVKKQENDMKKVVEKDNQGQ